MNAGAEHRWDLPWTAADLEKAKEIQALGQTHLAAQLQTALAADARATSMGGQYIALALATLAGGFGYWQSAHNTSALWAALTTGGMLLLAAALAGWSARPTQFYLPGTPPETWFNSIDDDVPTLIGGQAEIDDRDIRRNRRLMIKNGRAVFFAFWLAVAAPAFGAGVWLISESRKPASESIEPATQKLLPTAAQAPAIKLLPPPDRRAPPLVGTEALQENASRSAAEPRK